MNTKHTPDGQKSISMLRRERDDLVAALEAALQTAEFEKHPYRGWHLHARDALSKAKGE